MKASMLDHYALCCAAGIGIMILTVPVATAVSLYNTSFETVGSSTDYASHWEYNHPDTHGGVWGSGQRASWRAHTGTYEAAIKGTWAGLGDTGGWWQEMAATAGESYDAVGWFWADNTWSATTQHLKIEFRSATDQLLATSSLEDLSSVGESWVQHRVRGTAPANTAWARVVVSVSGAGGAGALQFDDLDLNLSVPEPASAVIMIMGLLGIAYIHHRRA